jgi:hypothetical protein
LANTHLKASKNVTIEEKLLIFLHITTRPASNRDTQERFSRSGDTISQYLNTLSFYLYKANTHSCFHAVLDALLVLYPRFTSLLNAGTPLATRILDNPKYYPYFDNCLGALDGTHVSMHVPLEEQSQYRNRKGTLSQNMLAVCNFDMQFVFVLPGWEGSAHDGRVLSNAQSRHNFNTPKGKYWLGDAGYGNSEYVMAPYRGVRYHLKEQRQADLKPNNAKELFNLRHASLRNVIERIFGVVLNGGHVI